MPILLNFTFEDIKQHKHAVFAVLVFVVLIVIVAIYYGSFGTAKRAILGGERTVRETPIPRVVENARTVDGRFVASTGESIRLVNSEHVVVEGGKTLKESYALAEPEAALWAPDAKLVYIRSLGTVTVEGFSSGWEVAFGSKAKKKSYVLSVIGGVVADKKEGPSESVGYALPTNWYDAGDAIMSIRDLPQFRDATISGLNFYYNEDGKRWGYAIASSNGTVAIPVR